MNIVPVGDAIHDDFYSVAGSGLAPDAVMEFQTALGTLNVSPTLVRPHLALVERLPNSLPVGAASLRLTSASGPCSNSAPVTIMAGPPQTVRVLQPGEAKAQPYCLILVANPGIQPEVGSGFAPDPILANRPGYHQVVGHCLRNLFSVAEDLLRQGEREARMRVVSVFDGTRPADGNNSLVHEVPNSEIMETRRGVLAPFLATVGLGADMVFVIHGSMTHTRASAWFTTDDRSASGVAYSFDGVSRTHGRFCRIPGSAAISVRMAQNGLTVIHEFIHGASDFGNGMAADLYNDAGDGMGFMVNKKFRSSVGNHVPADFADYNGVAYAADPARDSLGYPSNWRSYHPEPIDASRPNLMDNYWLASDDPQLCRLDGLAYAWMADRLEAKLTR